MTHISTFYQLSQCYRHVHPSHSLFSFIHSFVRGRDWLLLGNFIAMGGNSFFISFFDNKIECWILSSSLAKWMKCLLFGSLTHNLEHWRHRLYAVIIIIVVAIFISMPSISIHLYFVVCLFIVYVSNGRFEANKRAFLFFTTSKRSKRSRLSSFL